MKKTMFVIATALVSVAMLASVLTVLSRGRGDTVTL